MRKLHLVGLTTDRDGLIFTARQGSKSGGFIVPLDDRVLAAIADAGRLDNGAPPDDGVALPEVEAVPKRLRSESALTPREMQARLRAGRSIDEVAAEAGVDTEWVARFAVPILAEQAQVVELARALVYAKPRLGESSQPLGSSVLQNLSDRGVFLPDDIANAGWSAFQLHDSVWMVRFRYRSRGRDQEAQWEIDVPTGRLRARNRHASDLGYVDPQRWRAPDPEAVVDDEETPVAQSQAKVRPKAKRLTAAKPVAVKPVVVKKAARASKVASAPKAVATRNGTRGTRAATAKAGKAATAGRVSPTRTAATPSSRTASAKAAPAGVKRPSRTTTAKSAPARAKGSPKTVSAKAPARRKAAKAVPASETGPTAGSGGARMAAAQVSTARVAASMATADREPWAAAVRRPSRSQARSASPGARGTDGRLRPATPEPPRSPPTGDPDDVRAFEPRPLPRGGQEPARPRVRKVTVPRPRSNPDDAPTMTLPAPRQPGPAQEPMPVERSKRRRLRSR